MAEFIIRIPVSVDGLGDAAWSGSPLEASIAVKVTAKGHGAALERLSRALELVAAEPAEFVTLRPVPSTSTSTCPRSLNIRLANMSVPALDDAAGVVAS